MEQAASPIASGKSLPIQAQLRLDLDQSWDVDVPFVEVPNAGTHLRLWPAARCFCNWLQTRGCAELGWKVARWPCLEGADAPHLLELGSGLGWLGLVIAKNLPGARLTLTDLPGEPTSSLKSNVLRAATALALPVAPAVHQLDWAEFVDAACAKPEGADAYVGKKPILPGILPCHTVFGTDLCWDKCTTVALASVLSFIARSALTPGGWPRVIYAHWNRSSAITSLLIDELVVRGLTVRVLHPPHFSPQPDGFLHQLLVQKPFRTNETCVGSSRFISKVDDSASTCLESSYLGSKGEGSLSTDACGLAAEHEQPLLADMPGTSVSANGVDDTDSWDELNFQLLFGEERDRFPDPCFFVFEVLASPCTDTQGDRLD